MSPENEKAVRDIATRCNDKCREKGSGEISVSEVTYKKVSIAVATFACGKTMCFWECLNKDRKQCWLSYVSMKSDARPAIEMAIGLIDANGIVEVMPRITEIGQN